MAEDLQTQLDRVQAAIARIEGDGQSWTQGNRSATQAQLDTLYAREKDLLARIANQTRGGMRVRQIVPRG